MPLTAAERQRRRRQKLKEEGKYEEYKKKNNAEAFKSRKKKDYISKLPKAKQLKVKREIRENIKTRVARCRALKKAKVSGKTIASPPAFKSASALGKATARARRSLPLTPRRKVAVIKRLFVTEIDFANMTDLTSEESHQRSSALPASTIQLVKKFYEDDNISQQAPGRKDVVRVQQDDGSKGKMQTRHLLISIKEAYRLFVEDNPVEVKIGKSKFASLRPKHILLSSKLPHNVCLCKYHENFISAVNDLHKKFSFIPSYTNDFPSQLTCEIETMDCWMNKCNSCKHGKGFMNFLKNLPEIDNSAVVTWHVWKTAVNERICKVVEEGTVEELIKYIQSLVPQFLEHVFIKRHQANIYKQQHQVAKSASFSKNVCLIQVDFSENYTCVSQDEIMSAHWSQCQISLFTVAMWHSGIIHPIVIASDDRTHAKETVLPYMDRIFEEMPTDIQEVRIWSDGPNSQFKNKYIAAALSSQTDEIYYPKECLIKKLDSPEVVNACGHFKFNNFD